MAKKRGGLAGLYDRNKGLFRTAAILGGTALGGPAGGAIAGAAMRGLDRPGKRGIGFDVKQGALGGLGGYLMGKTAQSVGGGLKGMFAPSAAPSLPVPNMTVGVTPGMGGVTSPVTASVARSAAPSPDGNMIQKLLSGLTQRQGTGNRPLYYDVLSGTGKGLLSERQSQRTEALKRAEMEENKRQFDALFGLRQQDAAIAAAQEADRKRREEQRMANREALRALFTGA